MTEVEGVGLHRQRRRAGDAPHHLEPHAVVLGEANAPASARLVQAFHRRGAGRLARQLVQVLLGPRPEGDTLDLRIALLGDVDVVHRIGAAHVQRVGRTLCRQQPEIAQELLGEVEVRRPQTNPGDILHTNDRLNHRWPLRGGRAAAGLKLARIFTESGRKVTTIEGAAARRRGRISRLLRTAPPSLTLCRNPRTGYGGEAPTSEVPAHGGGEPWQNPTTQEARATRRRCASAPGPPGSTGSPCSPPSGRACSRPTASTSK